MLPLVVSKGSMFYVCINLIVYGFTDLLMCFHYFINDDFINLHICLVYIILFDMYPDENI